MKLSKLSPLMLFPTVIIPMSLVSCSNDTEPEEKKEFEITHSGNFEKTFSDCLPDQTYTVTFDFTCNKDVDLTVYDLKVNTNLWTYNNATISYSWEKSNLTLKLKIAIKLNSYFETQTVVSCTNGVRIEMIEKSSSKSIKTFTYGTLKIVLNEKIEGDEHFVSFETNGGTTVATQKIKTGECATKPTTTKTDYSFVNWFNKGEVFDFSTPITKDVALSAYWTESDPYDFIWNRSFSLGCWGQDIEHPEYADLGWGTCWILSDATPDVYNDYNYWIATNWHVVDGQDEVQASSTGFKVGYSDNRDSGGIQPMETGYTVFDSYQFEGYDKFYFDKSNNQAIDFVVAKANFASAPSATKEKLNKLNYQQQTQGYINRFAYTSVDKHYENNITYLAGFPVQRDYYATWENHSIPKGELTFYNSMPHKVDSAESISDNSYQYIDDKDYGSSWMKGGASGSMLITKIDNEWSPIGIYWGGWTNDTQTALYPSFSIFKSLKKDFTYNYV